MDIDGKIYCPKCMRVLENEGACPWCGYAASNESFPSALSMGTLLNGRYQLGAVIGQGGFGITYAAWDELLGAPVAIKEYFPLDYAVRNTQQSDEVETPESSRAVYLDGMLRFQRESHLLAELQGIPEIVKVLDFFSENNTSYIVMEYIRGVAVDKWVKDKKLSTGEILKLIRPAVDALVSTHRQGVLHRDLTPSNILVREDGTVKLIDFGSATEQGRSNGTVMLTRKYASVEQYGSEHGSQGPWTDVYGISAVLYTLLCGEEPQEAVTRVYNDRLAPPKKQRVPLKKYQNDAIMAGLRVKPENRVQSMDEFRSLLYHLPAPEVIRRQKRLLRRLSLIAAVLFAIIAVVAANFSVGLPLGQGLLYSLRSDGWHVKNRIYEKERQEIPEMRLGIKVSKIDDGAFRGDTSLETLTVPGSVKDIGDTAFYHCAFLEQVDLAEGVETLGMNCFGSCANLKEVALPESLKSAPDDTFSGAPEELMLWGHRGSYAESFADGQKLRFADESEMRFEENENGLTLISLISDADLIVIPTYFREKPVTEIGADVRIETAKEAVLSDELVRIPPSLCKDNKELIYLHMGNNVRSVGESAFENCSQLTALEWSPVLESVEMRAFAGCSCISSVDFPDGMTRVGTEAFSFCYGITSVCMPNSLTELGERCFWGCRDLNEVRLSEELTVLPEAAFAYTGLTAIDLPDKLRVLDGSFSNSELEYILIPESVETIGYGTFSGCKSLKYIQFMCDDVDLEGNLHRQFWLCPQNLVIGGRQNSSAQALADVTGFTFEDIESWSQSMKLKGDTAAFTYGMDKAVRVPWFNAAENCPIRHTKDASLSSPNEVELPLFQEEIGSNEFSRCLNLKRVTAAGTIRVIGPSAFSDCNALKEVPVSDGLEIIDDGAFERCYSLAGITVPDSVKQLGNRAFYESGLERIELGRGIRNLEPYCLAWTNLTSITIPGNVMEISEDSLGFCISLVNLTLEEGVRMVDSYALEGCAALETVVLPSTLMELGNRAFDVCTSLKDVWVYNPDMEFPMLLYGNPIHSYKLIIHGYSGSTAEAYTAGGGYQFEAIEVQS